MPAVLKDLFSSKKFLVMLAAIIMAIASKLGLNLDPQLLNEIIALAAAYIVGQGIADHGKEAAIVQTQAAFKAAANDNVSTSTTTSSTTTIEPKEAA